MKKFFFSVVALAGLFLTSCGNDPAQEVAPATKEGKEISLQASMADFTRATDTAFEQGDQIGLFIFNPEAYLSNVAYTFGANGFAAASKQVWYEDETLESQVVAYYPYSATVGTFTVAAAQTSHAAYTASDLMVASTTATPTENAITLPFQHMLSKVNLTVVNETDDAVKSVCFANVAGQVAYEVKNAAETLKASGSMTIEAGLLEDGTYTLIMAPQTVAPKMVITTESGQQYNFKVENAVEFKAGTGSTASVKIEKPEEPLPPTPPTPDPIEVVIDWTIADWAEGEELNFVQSEEEIVVPEGVKVNLVVNDNWKANEAYFAAYYWTATGDAWVVLTATEDAYIYEGEVAADATGMIFCRMNPAYTTPGWNVSEGEVVVEEHVWTQTDDLVVPTDANNYYYVTGWTSGEWHEAGYEFPEVTLPATLYLQPNENWKQANARFAAYFFNNGETWVDMTDADADGIYEVVVPTEAAYPNVIFCRMNPGTTENTWANKWNQTGDLTMPTDANVLYIVPADAWDGSDDSAWTMPVPVVD